MQAVSLKGEGRRGVRVFLFDHVTKFFRDVEGDFRVESLSVDAFVSLVRQLGAEVVEEVGAEFIGLAEELGARPRRGERYRRGDLIALVGERVLLLAPAEGDGQTEAGILRGAAGAEEATERETKRRLVKRL